MGFFKRKTSKELIKRDLLASKVKEKKRKLRNSKIRNAATKTLKKTSKLVGERVKIASENMAKSGGGSYGLGGVYADAPKKKKGKKKTNNRIHWGF